MFIKIYDTLKKIIKENFVFLLICFVVFFIMFVKLPFQVEMPGGIIPLDKRVLIDGKETSLKGSFNMAYVSVAQGNIPYILLGLILPDWDVVSNKEVMYENETVEDANKRDKLYLEQSKNNAIVSALSAAGIPYTLKDRVNVVLRITNKADTTLEIGDHILLIEGESYQNIEDIKRKVQTKEEGDSISFLVERDGKEISASAVVYLENEEKYIGVSTVTMFSIDTDVTIEINTKKSESGPSGGMMMSLILYNALTNQDLTHGKKIVGTGTISEEGVVGEIGGIKYKTMGAYNNGADIFLVPKENYDEAVKTNVEKGYGLTIVAVSTLQDAIIYLEGLDE